MIRFRRLFDVSNEVDRRQLAEVHEIFLRVFPYDAATADRIAAVMRDATKADFEPVLLTAEDERSRVLAFAFIYYFPELKCAYLDYIASHPDRPARGIGGALYEAVRELLVNKGGHGLFFDVPTDEAERLKDPARLPANKKRLRFYERYGALPVLGTLYNELPTQANDGWLTHLAFDGLGGRHPLRRAELRRALARIFEAKYRMAPDHPEVRRILASVREDPVRLREPRYTPAEETAVKRGLLKPMKVVVVENHEIHHLRERGYVERPVRVDAVLRGLDGLPVERVRPRHFGEDPIRAVHDPHLVSYLEKVSSNLGPKALLYPTVFPIRRPERRPREWEMRAGYFCADTFTPLSANTYRAARASVDCALTGANLLLSGDHLAYALTRPPGHHAEWSVFGGFCYFNNAAIAAHLLSRRGRVALLDIDYHHGNGAQDIFYRRSDVLTVSIHGHPNIAYPYFSGFADERGDREGMGYNRNYPLREGTDDAGYLEALDHALADVRRFKPDWFIVSLGFDVMRGDPTGTFAVSARGMRQIGERVGRVRIPTLVVQEGGYSRWNLRRGARAFFNGLVSAWY